MKKLKFMSMAMILVLGFSILAFGIYAISPTQNTIQGAITLDAVNQPLIIKCYLDEVKPENLQQEFNEVRSGIKWTRGIDDLKFDLSNANTIQDVPARKLIMQIENPTSNNLVAYFTKDGTSITNDVLKSESETSVANVTLKQITTLNAGKTIEMTITLKASAFLTSGESQKANINYGLKIEEQVIVPEEEAGETTSPIVTLPAPTTEAEKTLTLEKVEAYKTNTNIETLIIPEGITKINNDFFIGAEGNYGGIFSESTYKTIIFPTTLIALNSYELSCCYNLETVVIQSDITVIPTYAFYNSTNLKNINIPDSVTKIESRAFGGCNLSEIDIPLNIKTIEENAFANCNLKIINIKGGTKLTTQFVLPNDIYNIGYTFKGWYTNAEGTGEPVTAISTEPYTQDTTYYAVFTPNN